MKALLVTLLLATPVHQVSGKVTRYVPWCGGAVGQGHEETAAGVVLTFYPGDTFTGAAPAGSAPTGKDGKFKLSLPDGKYCVLSAPRAPKPEPIDGGTETQSHLDCRMREWSRCERVLEVKGAPVGDFRIGIGERCSWAPPPCYDGPPMPAPP